MNNLWIRMSPLWATFSLAQAMKRVRAFGQGESGAAAILFAVSSPVWIGGLALGAEVGSWLFYQQRLQATADAVAESIASRVGTGASQQELDTLAVTFLTANQFRFCQDCWKVTLAAPSGPIFVNGNTVNVQLKRPVTRFITRFFQSGNFDVSASSSAQVTMATQGCILGLGLYSTAADVGLANVSVTGCEVLSNGNSRVGVGSNLTTDCARSRNTITVLGTLSVTCRNGQPDREAGMTLDPYADISDFDLSTIDCDKKTNDPIVISSATDSIANYVVPIPRNGRNYVRLCAPRSVTIQSPIGTPSIPNYTFIFDGVDFRINDSNVTANSASAYFVNGGRILINAPNKTVNLKGAAFEGGMLFRGARANADVINQIAVGPGSNLQGAIYFPSSNVQFRAAGNVSGCMQIIASTVTLLQGTWQMTGPCTINNYLRPIVASRTVRLTQ